MGNRLLAWVGRQFIGLGWCMGCTLLTGCPNPQTYGTPRTTPKGKVSHTVAAEAMMVTGTVETYDTDADGNEVLDEERVSLTFAVPPTYQFRYGVSNQVDFGIRVANMSSLGGDVKLNPVRGDFDLAVAPGFQWFSISVGNESFSLVYLHLPLLLGVNFSEDTSLVFTPGVVYAHASSSVSADADADQDGILSAGGMLGRFGVGFDFRVNPHFGLHPEVTAMRGLSSDIGDNEGTIVMFGLGFNIANLPDYSDVGGGAAAEP